MTLNPRTRQTIPTFPLSGDEAPDARFDRHDLGDAPETGPPVTSRAPTIRVRPLAASAAFLSRATAPVPLAVRIGDILQVNDTTRLALVVADTATDLLDQHGDMPKTVASLRAQIAALRGT